MKTYTLWLVLALGLIGCNINPQTDAPIRGLPIAKHAIPAGTVIQAQDIEVLELETWELDAPELPRKFSQIVGHKALEDIPKTGSIPLTRVSQ